VIFVRRENARREEDGPVSSRGRGPRGCLAAGTAGYLVALGGGFLTWRPLSIRDGARPDDGPFEGVPHHLFAPLRDWVNRICGGTPLSLGDVHNGPRLAAAIRVVVVPAHRDRLTVRDVTASMIDTPDLMLDAVDAVFHLGRDFGAEDYQSLNEILELGGSIWRADSGQCCLIRRADPTAAKAFGDASLPSDVASAELRNAWIAAYGRNPDPSDAWDHSIKAVEAVLIPIVTPAKTKATLGDVVGSLSSQGSPWQLVLHGHDGSMSVEPLVSMLRLIWPNPDRHGGSTSRRPSLDEAQAVVNLAVTLVQWARANAITRR
jgi:hypothetical protein